jgi:hypothetical protein
MEKTKEGLDLENEFLNVPMPPDMDRATFTALLNVLKYLMHDEWRHWRECGSPRKGHIYCDLRRLRQWASDVTERMSLDKGDLPETDQ